MKAGVSVDIQINSSSVGFFLSSVNTLQCSSVYLSGELINEVFESCKPFLRFCFDSEIIAFKAIPFFTEEDVKEHYNV